MRYYNFLKLVTEAQNRSNIIIGIIVSKSYAPAVAKKEGEGEGETLWRKISTSH